jgi:hypothetical protein
MRNEPGQLSDFLVVRQRQDESGAADRFQFDEFRDLDVAYFPEHFRASLIPG